MSVFRTAPPTKHDYRGGPSSSWRKRKKLRDPRRPRPIKTARSSVFGSGYFSNVDEPAALPPLI
jgi:hypothetical protein